MSKLFLTNRIPPDYNRQAWVEILRQIETLNNSQVDGYLFPSASITSNDSPYLVTVNDAFLPVDASTGSVTIALKPVAEARGKRLTIKKIDSSNNTVTVDGNGSETIDDELTQIISIQYDSICVMSDGTEWWIV
jgi:hypothetical protein